ncbi:RNA methyltransferase [Bacteroidetes/Chlorobi group bacterium ChocPot_Mid]|jgi:TrmH family RNA methyltransferase|nr:MAG: RNA methyltransferase [Bacteroidetes/Chlorobi group bacterium ChocPot_Mid]
MIYQELTKEQVKLIKSLHKKKGREEHKLFIAEGYKISEEILESNYEPEFVVLPGNANDDCNNLADKIAKKYSAKIFKTPRKIFESLSDTETAQDIMLCVKIREEKVVTTQSFISLDRIADPGNVGTIIRTAEWFGFQQVLLSKGCADLYNPKTIRSSMGAVFKIKCIQNVDLLKVIPEKFFGHTILGTFLDAKKYINEIEINNNFGIILGNESQGIQKGLENIVSEKVKIKGNGNFDSLNVSVAAGIVMYELALKKLIK